MEWQPEIDELARRSQFADDMGGAAAVERQHGAGRLTIRERIAGLLDPSSFRELSKLTGQSEYDSEGRLQRVVPAPYVIGTGEIEGRPVAVGGEDFTVRGGESWNAPRRKGGQGGLIEDLAFEYRIPLINLIDGSGGSVASIGKRGHAVFPGVHGFERSVQLLGIVPVVSVVLGVAAGGPAGRAVLSHFSIMVRRTSQLFAAGPPIVARAMKKELTREELGGSDVAVNAAGTIDNVADSEEEALAMARSFLSFMPQNVWEAPMRIERGDPADRREAVLNSLIPRNRRQPYDMRKLIGLVIDRDSGFEIQKEFGRSLIVMLARIDGYAVGIVANNPMIYGGAMDHCAARKQTHFIELCDTFHIPILYLVDQPGFMIGPQAERAGTLRDGMRAVFAGMQATVPAITVVVRKCYGMAGMAACDKAGLNFKVCWPSAEIGNLPVEGGVKAAFKNELAVAADPSAREAEIEAELKRLSSPFRMAEAFAVEDMIEPAETRAYLARMLKISQAKIRTSLGVKTISGVRP